MLSRTKSYLALCALAAVVTTSCGDGYSEEDATTFCDQERTAFGQQCVTDAVYDQCLDCYLECGSDCDRAAACPEEYTCRTD